MISIYYLWILIVLKLIISINFKRYEIFMQNHPVYKTNK